MKKTLGIIGTVLMVVAMAWIGISYIEIISKNLSEHPTYWSYNLFNMLVNMR
jgi:hypothetical protein